MLKIDFLDHVAHIKTQQLGKVVVQHAFQLVVILFHNHTHFSIIASTPLNYDSINMHNELKFVISR